LVSFLSVEIALDGAAAAGGAAEVTGLPQEKQNLLTVGLEAPHEPQTTPLVAVVWATGGRVLPHEEQNRFPAGLPAPQAGHDESG
jgi:D-serine dehydratase